MSKYLVHLGAAEEEDPMEEVEEGRMEVDKPLGFQIHFRKGLMVDSFAVEAGDETKMHHGLQDLQHSQTTRLSLPLALHQVPR